MPPGGIHRNVNAGGSVGRPYPRGVSATREIEELRGEQRPALEERAPSVARRVAALVPLVVAPRRLDELRARDQRGEALGRRARVVWVARAAAEHERRHVETRELVVADTGHRRAGLR